MSRPQGRPADIYQSDLDAYKTIQVNLFIFFWWFHQGSGSGGFLQQMSYDSPDTVTDGMRVKVIKAWMLRENRALLVHLDSQCSLFCMQLWLVSPSNANSYFVLQAEVTDPQVNSYYRPPDRPLVSPLTADVSSTSTRVSKAATRRTSRSTWTWMTKTTCRPTRTRTWVFLQPPPRYQHLLSTSPEGRRLRPLPI